MAPDAREVRLGSLLPLGPATPGAAFAWKSDGQSILFVTPDDAGAPPCPGLWERRIDGGPLRRVSPPGIQALSAEIDPRDQAVVWAGRPCSSPPTGDAELYRTLSLDPALTRQLTSTTGDDTAPALCGVDGRLIWTSWRDGDGELYAQAASGGPVERLTRRRGIDTDATWSPDCTRLAWVAESTSDGRVTRELWISRPTGEDAHPVTTLRATWLRHPAWHPDGRSLVFVGAWGSATVPRPELWTVRDDGTGLERITTTGDGHDSPRFSPDGRRIAFVSARTPGASLQDPGRPRGGQLYVAPWTDRVTPSDRIRADLRALADESASRVAVDEWLEDMLSGRGLVPAFASGFRQGFHTTGGVRPLQARIVDAAASAPLQVLGPSGSARLRAPVVDVGDGVVAPELGLDDYARVDVRGRLALARRFAPLHPATAQEPVARRLGDLRWKARLAREHGALGLLVVDAPRPPPGAASDWQPPPEAPPPPLRPEDPIDTSFPVVLLPRDDLSAVREVATRGGELEMDVQVQRTQRPSMNLVGRLGADPDRRLPGVVVVVAARSRSAHADPDDSGLALLLELVRRWSEPGVLLRRDVIVAMVSEEGWPRSGSTALALAREHWGDEVLAVIDLDRVGHLAGSTALLGGIETADAWGRLTEAACDAAAIDCRPAGDALRPGNYLPFFEAGVPVLQVTTPPAGGPGGPDADGIARLADLTDELLRRLVNAESGPVFRRRSPPAAEGDGRPQP